MIEDVDRIIINSSGGKDSLCALWLVACWADAVGYPNENIYVSHQDLGEVEWPYVKQLVETQALRMGIRKENVIYSKRRDKDGKEETLLEYVRRRGKWPSRDQRYCTSDFKRGPGDRVVTALTKGLGECTVLYVFGFRSQESPARAKKKLYSLNKRLTTKKRTVIEHNPILEWSEERVWETIHEHSLPYHKAYDLGMPRLSCMFCIFSPKSALILAGQQNPELLDEYIKVEEEIGHDFRHGFKIAEVKEAIERGDEVGPILNWIM